MASEALRGAVLIVVMNRDDRRALFETLDAYEFDAIYTAKDFAQAHAFLRQDPRLDAILLEFLRALLPWMFGGAVLLALAVWGVLALLQGDA